MEDLLRKIRALQAKADSTNNPAEAAAFAAKVAELLARHNLDPSVVRERSGGEGEKIHQTRYDSVNNGGWRSYLVSKVAQIYFCDIWLHTHYPDGKTSRLGYVFVGKPHNIEVAVSMYDYLEKTVLRLARNYSKLRVEKLRFEKGCGLELCTILQARYEAMKNGIVDEGDGSGLPALYDTEEKAVEIFMKELNLNPGRKSTFRTGSNATKAGRDAAHTINLGGQVTNRSSTALPGN